MLSALAAVMPRRRYPTAAAAAGYAAFMSYSHAADGRLAPRLQEATETYAAPWYRRRLLRIFRDETSLGVTPHLWPTIRQALDRSRFLILMASPEAARSPWVEEEVRHWLATKGPETLLLVRTGGAILWDRTARDFDWGATTALPPALRGRFRDEPLHVDLTGLGERADDLTLHDTRFAGAVLRLAATLHDRPADELNVQAVRELRRRLRVAYGGAGLILVLAAAAAIAALGFRHQRDVAARELKKSQAARVWGGLPVRSEALEPPEREALWDLATLGPEVRAVFVRQMADDPAWRLADRPALTLALKLAQRPEPVLRALGLRPGPGQTAEDLAAVLLDDIPKAPYPNEMQTLAGAARALSPRLPPDKVRAATAAVLGALVATDDPFALRSATLALRALPVPAATRRDPGVVGPVLYGLEHAADPDAATALAQALQALAPDLDDDQAKAALAAVLAALGRASDPKAVDALAEAAGALPLPPESGQAAVLGPVLDAVGRACPCALPTVAGALRALVPKLGPATARPALDAVLAAAGRGVDAETADALAQAARALRVRPDPERTRTVLGALAGAGDLGTFQSAAWTVRVLAPVLASGGQAGASLGPVLAALDGTSDPGALTALARAVQALGPGLAPDRPGAAVGAVAAAAERTTDPEALAALAQAAVATGGPKVGGQAGAMLAPVLGALRRTDAARTLIALGQAARALAPGLDAGQAETALAVVLDAVPRTNGPKARAALAQAAQALVPALPRPLPTDRRQGLLRLAQARLADAALAEAAVAWAGVLEAMLRPLADGDYVAAVVELLKYPSAALRLPPEDGGPASATAYLLDRLRERFPAADGLRGGGLPDALAWITWTFPRLDLGHGPACDVGPAVTHDVLSVSGDAPWPEGCGIFRLNS